MVFDNFKLEIYACTRLISLKLERDKILIFRKNIRTGIHLKILLIYIIIVD